MRQRFNILLAVPAAILVLSAALFAHHGAAGQDMTKLTTLKGTVTDYQFINPHVLLYVDVKDGSGKIEKWVAELNGPNELMRQHITKNTLKPGDEVTIIGNRSKNGSNFMRLHSFITPGGQEIVLFRGGDFPSGSTK
ncbi:MAG TPA: DUF6152 family protein [Candidatus Acidoferrales bacterium]|jgi:hypothetical protein|nr:DUF6152 family protein [Candidatus Acidoferrales bacterium]